MIKFDCQRPNKAQKPIFTFEYKSNKVYKKSLIKRPNTR